MSSKQRSRKRFIKHIIDIIVNYNANKNEMEELRTMLRFGLWISIICLLASIYFDLHGTRLHPATEPGDWDLDNMELGLLLTAQISIYLIEFSKAIEKTINEKIKG